MQIGQLPACLRHSPSQGWHMIYGSMGILLLIWMRVSMIYRRNWSLKTHTNTINNQPTWVVLAPWCPCSPLSNTSSSTWQASLLRPGLQSSSRKFILLGLVLLRALGNRVSSVKQCCLRVLQANLWSKHTIPSPTYKVTQNLKYLAKPLYFRSISSFKFSD